MTHYIDAKETVIGYLSTAEMVADILTKPLHGSLFLKFAAAMTGAPKDVEQVESPKRKQLQHPEPLQNPKFKQLQHPEPLQNPKFKPLQYPEPLKNPKSKPLHYPEPVVIPRRQLLQKGSDCTRQLSISQLQL